MNNNISINIKKKLSINSWIDHQTISLSILLILYIVILIHIVYLIFIRLERSFVFSIKTWYDLIIKSLINFLIKSIYINRDQIVNKKNNFLLFIELINIFESIVLPLYHLKLKKNCIIILLKNLQQSQELCNKTRL